MANLIVGHVGATESRIWVRGEKERRFAWLQLSHHAEPQRLELLNRHFFTGVFHLKGLEDDRPYRGNLWLTSEDRAPEPDDTPIAQCHFRTPPLVQKPFTFLFGSCNGPSLWGATVPGRMWERIDEVSNRVDASFMIHCGDQIYVDMPPKWDKNSYDLPFYRKKYVQAWSLEEAQPVFRNMAHYMILDDHELINDYAADLELDDVPINWLSAVALKAYREFQHIKNPQSFGSDALHYTFSWGSSQFFVCDTRTERINRIRQIIGPQQMARLKSWLLQAPAASPKFIVTSVPFVGQINTSPQDKWRGFPQRHELISFLFEHRLKNVFFLTGDMHNAYNAEMHITDGSREVVVRELMSSPLNQLFKAGQWAYDMNGDWEPISGSLKFRSQIREESFYGKHSLVSSVNVTEHAVTVAYHRTKKDKLTGVGPFSLPLS